MGSTTGIKSQLDAAFVAAANDKARVRVLRNSLPQPDTLSSDGAIQTGILGFFDEMSPIMAAQLFVELTALEARIT
jgi:hypothetical protein